MLEIRIDHISQTITSLQQQNTLLIRTVDTLNKKIDLETKERKKLEKRLKFFPTVLGRRERVES
jgi:hypothetical protein